MTIDIDISKKSNKFMHGGRKFELRKNWDCEWDEVIVRYELFINGRELDLSLLLFEREGDELGDYLALPYAENGDVLSKEDFPKEKLLEYLHKIADRYNRSSKKSTLFLE